MTAVLLFCLIAFRRISLMFLEIANGKSGVVVIDYASHLYSYCLWAELPLTSI